MLFDQDPACLPASQSALWVVCHWGVQRVCVALYICYHDPWLWITFTMHQLIINYCLVVILISLMMLHWDHHRQGSISLTPHPPSILGSLSTGLCRIFLKSARWAFNDGFWLHYHKHCSLDCRGCAFLLLIWKTRSLQLPFGSCLHQIMSQQKLDRLFTVRF